MEKYDDNIARVSHLVDYAFPYTSDTRQRVNDWLRSHNITEEEYMETASTRGTEVHTNVENFILGKPPLPHKEELVNEIRNGINYVRELRILNPNSKLIPEVYIRDGGGRFQGTCDLARIEGKNVRLYDWKTYKICKKRWKHLSAEKLRKDGTPLQPTDKIKKVSLQLSLYAERFIQQGYTIKGLYLVWLHDTGAHEYECTLRDREALNKFVYSFLTKDIMGKENLVVDDIKSPLKIKIQTAPVAYSAISVELDLATLPKGVTATEAIKEAISVQKRLHNNYVGEA